MEFSVDPSQSVKSVAQLHDKAIEFLSTAIEAAKAGDINRRWQATDQARGILLALRVSLDKENGGEIAANLERVYNFISVRLLDLDMKNDTKPADEAIDLLDPLRQSWHQLANEIDADPARLH